MLKSTIVILIFSLSYAHCQFLYNYEERSDDTQVEEQIDPNQYQPLYPSVSEQHIQPSQPAENPSRAGRSKTHIRIRSRNYPEPTNNNNPQVDIQKLRQERQERRRQRQREYFEPGEQPQRAYGPSVFERIELGEPPAGVYVPQDSLLNVLKSPGSAYQPVLPGAQMNNFVQSAVSYAPESQNRFYVQPPSNRDDTSPRRLILPVSKPHIAKETPSRHRRVQSLQGRSVHSGQQMQNRLHRQRPKPVVDIDSYREHTDEMPIEPKVEYMTLADIRDTRPIQRSRIIRIEPSSSQVYSPSIFEKVGLGEAPNGVYVPQDSLLNVLRNPTALQPGAAQNRYDNPFETYSYEEEMPSEPETVNEGNYQPPPQLHSTTRSQLNSKSRLSQNRGFKEMQVTPGDKKQNTHQRKRNENVRNVERIPKVQKQPQQQATAVISRSQQQTSRGHPFKEAKLALKELPMDADDDGIPGEAGTDYPTFHKIPRTSFSCSQQSHNGYYADLETSCQVVHLCQARGVKHSFLCPNGTIFNQENFSCQWWYKVNCNDAPNFYIKNDELYKIPEKNERKRS